jgi:hypothetical protein
MAKDVQSKSVGEKASPLPLLSTGASEMIVLPLFRCIAEHLRPPWYLTSIECIIFIVQEQS